MNIFSFLNKNWMPLLLAFIPATIIIGPISLPKYAYYGLLITFFFIDFLNAKTFNFKFLAFIGCLCFGAMLSEAPPFFKILERLGLFTLLLGAVTPMFQSRFADNIHYKALKITIYICIALSILSFFGYFAGINYMMNYWTMSYDITSSGSFGGFTKHSMLLGPCAAISITAIANYYFFKEPKGKKKWFVLGGMVACFSCILLTGSRASLVAAFCAIFVLMYMKFQKSKSKLIGTLVGLIAFMAVLYPVYSSYLTVMTMKQQANLEKGSTFASRQDKWENRLYEFKSNPVFGIGVNLVDTKFTEDYNPISGVVEPGSSWLAVLSMTGLLGTFIILLLIVPTTTRMYHKALNLGGDNIILFALLILFYIHMIVEGYIFAGGSWLCFTFWLLFGVCYVRAYD